MPGNNYKNKASYIGYAVKLLLDFVAGKCLAFSCEAPSDYCRLDGFLTSCHRLRA